ncbi:MAG: hypothetical protein R2712_02815 [Vicinamibacterales bacterium]
MTMARVLSVLLVSGVVALGARPAPAQSLGDLARREAARRKAAGETGRVYTNDDLTPDFTTPLPETVAPETPAPADDAPEATTVEDAAPRPDEVPGTEAVDADAASSTQPAPPASPRPVPANDEAFWRERATLLRTRLSDKTVQADTLRTRLATLDPADPERAVAAQALDRAVRDLEAYTGEWVRFEQQAREQGVPAHWIR